MVCLLQQFGCGGPAVSHAQQVVVEQLRRAAAVPLRSRLLVATKLAYRLRSPYVEQRRRLGLLHYQRDAVDEQHNIWDDHAPSESVDLVYLDPPFNTNRYYPAFDDTWRWHEAIEDFHQVVGQPRYKGTMEGLRLMLGEGTQLTYLSYMANRLLECRRVLKPTGSIYLHCDPTASHYLKLLMDAVFGAGRFRNEIIWCYGAGNPPKRDFARKHDVILRYTKTNDYYFDGSAPSLRVQFSKTALDMHFNNVDGGGQV